MNVNVVSLPSFESSGRLSSVNTNCPLGVSGSSAVLNTYLLVSECSVLGIHIDTDTMYFNGCAVHSTSIPLSTAASAGTSSSSSHSFSRSPTGRF